MPVIEKFVAVGEIKEPRADSVEANFSTSRQKSALMLGDGCSSVCLRVPFGVVCC
jgi:hypothetical protein